MGRSALWKGLNMLGIVESRGERDGKVSTECRFYIGSIGTDVACFARAVRGHWGIENDLHWSLDVAFREDESRLRVLGCSSREQPPPATTTPARDWPCTLVAIASRSLPFMRLGVR